MDIYETVKTKIKYWQKHGVPILFWRDESKNGPSVSLSMMMISFSLCVFSLVNKWAKVVDGVDVENSLQLFAITASLYFGRNIGKNKKKITPED